MSGASVDNLAKISRIILSLSKAFHIELYKARDAAQSLSGGCWPHKALCGHAVIELDCTLFKIGR